MKVLILNSQSGDWEGLFIDGKLINEGHTLGEGDKSYLLKAAEKYGFKSSDIIYTEVNDEDDEYLMDHGNFPSELNKLKGTYI